MDLFITKIVKFSSNAFTMFAFKQSSLTTCVIVLIWYSNYCYATLKIVNGVEIVPHSLPYMAAIKSEINGSTIRCAGSLIRTNQILTAASCVYGASNSTIILGAHNIEESEATQVTLESSDFIIHDDYDPKTHLNDIAIIKLAQEVALTDAIATISTPSIFDILKTYDDDLGVVAGWGKFNDSDSTYSSVPKKIEATIISYIVCTISYLGKVHSSQMCTTGMQNGQNICRGDSGSPLVVDGVQVGIASYGSDFGCSVGAPGVYTRLTSFYAWLLQHES